MIKKLDKIWFIIVYFELKEHYFKNLINLINKKYKKTLIHPEKKYILNFLRFNKFFDIHTVIIGQDPYCKKNQAHGIAFSVKKTVKIPSSLKNIYKELYDDIGVNNIDKPGNLEAWHAQGLLLLNVVLTVETDRPASHHNIGWEKFTDKIIQKLSNNKKKIIFIFLGQYASNKIKLIPLQKHITICTSHPSPLSANSGFLGSRIFSKINMNLTLINDTIKINWQN